MVEFDVHNLQKIKLGVHITQAAFIVISWVTEIVVFHDAAHIDGRPGWYFGVVRPLNFARRDTIYALCQTNID
jgi:hypothetical protein